MECFVKAETLGEKAEGDDCLPGDDGGEAGGGEGGGGGALIPPGAALSRDEGERHTTVLLEKLRRLVFHSEF